MTIGTIMDWPRLSDRPTDRPMCLIHFENGEIKGWFIAAGLDDARRKAEAIGAHDLARNLQMTEYVSPGKYEPAPGFVALVD